jgi:hypothetical protein
MTEQNNDEPARPAEPGMLPAYGSPPPVETSTGTGAPPAYGTPPPVETSPEPVTRPFGTAPPANPYAVDPEYPGAPPYSRPAPPNQPAYPGGGPYPGQGGYPGMRPAYPESSQAAAALICGIIGLFAFWPLAPVAWVLGRNELRAMDAGRRNPGDRGLAMTGMVMGIIGTVLLALVVVIVVIVVVALVSSAPMSSSG